MKVKCKKCNRVINYSKTQLVNKAIKAGAQNIEEYMQIFLCGACTRSILGKTKIKQQTSTKSKSKPDLLKYPTDTIEPVNEIKSVNIQNNQDNIDLRIDQTFFQIEPGQQTSYQETDNVDNENEDYEEEIPLSDLTEEIVDAMDKDLNDEDDIFTEEEQKVLDELINEEDDEEEI